MPSPQQLYNSAKRYEALRQQLANHQARHERFEAQTPLPPGPRPFQFIRPSSTSPFYTRPPAGAPTESTPTAVQDVGKKEPPFNPQKPVAIINGYLSTSTTYPEAWPLSYLAMTKCPGMRPGTQIDAKTGITGHVAEPVAAHLASTASSDASSDGVALAQPQTSQPHSSQSQTPQAQPTQELPKDGPIKEGEQPKPSAKRHLHPERHRGYLYTDTGLQGTRSGGFAFEYLNDESSSGSGSGSLRSLPPEVGSREGSDTSSSVIPGPSTIFPPPPNSLPSALPQSPLHRVLHSFIPTRHDELPVHTGELVYLLKVFNDGWCMVEDVLKQEGMLPRQCISDRPVRERSVEEDDSIRVSTAALSMTIARTIIFDHPGRNDVSDDGGGDGDDFQAPAAALFSLSTEAEPKDQIIDLLAQFARSRKVARAQVVADMAAANDAIELRAAARIEVEASETGKENDDEECGVEHDREGRRQRMNGLNAMLATEANRARFNQIIDQFARQEELEQQEQEILRREAVQERLSRDEAEQERYPRETSTGNASGQQEKLRRKAEKERLRREAGTERVIREIEEERSPSATAGSGSSAQQKKKKKERNNGKKNNQKKRGAW